jgi:hypothetical protein
VRLPPIPISAPNDAPGVGARARYRMAPSKSISTRPRSPRTSSIDAVPATSGNRTVSPVNSYAIP